MSDRYPPMDEAEQFRSDALGEIPDLGEVPSWLQLGVIVSDGSGSMTLDLPAPDETIPGSASKTKAAAANSATLDFLDRMEAGRKVHQFSLAWVSFNDRVTETYEPCSVTDLRSRGDFDPTRAGVGGTEIWTGLERAAELIEQWRRAPRYEDIPMSAVVVLMTDGEDASPDRTREVASRIKEMPYTRLAACFFATKGQVSRGPDFLRSIVSQPEGQNFKQVYNAEALREFFHASVTAIG